MSKIDQFQYLSSGFHEYHNFPMKQVVSRSAIIDLSSTRGLHSYMSQQDQDMWMSLDSSHFEFWLETKDLLPRRSLLLCLEKCLLLLAIQDR
jgi:hypothetical protein